MHDGNKRSKCPTLMMELTENVTRALLEDFDLMAICNGVEHKRK
jgi:hypothetical protein